MSDPPLCPEALVLWGFVVSVRPLGVDRNVADGFALVVDLQDALAGGEAYVVEIEADGLGDLGAGVEGNKREGLVRASVATARDYGR